MNSIAAYLIARLREESTFDNLHIHLGYQIFRLFGGALEPLITAITVMMIYRAIQFWMCRKKLFLSI